MKKENKKKRGVVNLSRWQAELRASGTPRTWGEYPEDLRRSVVRHPSCSSAALLAKKSCEIGAVGKEVGFWIGKNENIPGHHHIAPPHLIERVHGRQRPSIREYVGHAHVVLESGSRSGSVGVGYMVVRRHVRLVRRGRRLGGRRPRRIRQPVHLQLHRITILARLRPMLRLHTRMRHVGARRAT